MAYFLLLFFDCWRMKMSHWGREKEDDREIGEFFFMIVNFDTRQTNPGKGAYNGVVIDVSY